MRYHSKNKHLPVIFSTAAAVLLSYTWLATPSLAHEKPGQDRLMRSGSDIVSSEEKFKIENGAIDLPGRLRLPKMDPERGKRLFVSKGCIACHAVNGVGGHDGPALNAHSMDMEMNPFDFAAKMWRSASAMILMQEEAFGEQLSFTGDEFSDIAAFVHNDAIQHSFTEDDLTKEARKMMNHEHADKPDPADKSDHNVH